MVNEELLSNIHELTEFSKISTGNYKVLISKKKVFADLIQVLGEVAADEVASKLVIRCFAVLTGKDYQDNSFFVMPRNFFDLMIAFLNNPNLANNALIAITNIVGEQEAARDIFLTKFKPSSFNGLIDNYIGNPKVLLSISRLIAACLQNVIADHRVTTAVFNAALYLLQKSEIADNSDIITLLLFSIDQTLLGSDRIVNEQATNADLVNIMQNFFTSENLRVAEYALLVVSRIANNERFDITLINKEILFSLLSVEDESFLKALNRCIRSILINKRMFFYDDDYLLEKIETVMLILENASFSSKCEIAKAFDSIVSSSTSQQVIQLVRCKMLDILEFFLDFDTKDGEIAFLNLCKTILYRVVGVDLETAAAVYDFFESNEIFSYAQDKEDESDEPSVKNRAEMVLSAARNVKQYIDENA